MSNGLRRRISGIQKKIELLRPKKNRIRVTTVEIPNDLTPAARKQMIEEARASLPPDDSLLHDGIIALNFVTPGENGGFKYPEGREPEPGETWRITDISVQKVANMRRAAVVSPMP
jgi:hypothetical protein